MPKLIVGRSSGTQALPIEKATIKETSKAINTNWFASEITPSRAPATHRLMIRLATTAVVKVLMNDGTNSDIEHDLNDGTALDAGEAYLFDLIVPSGYSYNIQHETGTQNINAVVIEVPFATG